MRLINRVYIDLLVFLKLRSISHERSFFDFSSKEKKKLIREAAEGAVKMQDELLKEYYKIQNMSSR